jgi:ketosteroid isomerase-like protein
LSLCLSGGGQRTDQTIHTSARAVVRELKTETEELAVRLNEIGAIAAAALFFGSVTQVFAAADPTAIASAHSAKFDQAFAACNLPAVMELYEDGATAIYADQVAKGKAEIEKMVQSYCTNGHQQTPSYKQTGGYAQMLAPHWIMMVRTLDGVDEKGKPFRINATELMHQSGGQWRYVVDHASFGAPAAAAPGAAAKTP